MMFSPDSAIDGAVLDVILRKAIQIWDRTGVTVPLPDERGPVTDALMAAMMLRRGSPRQLVLDLRLEDGARAMEIRWRDVEENEKKSRARFAQNAMKPREVAPEWEKVRTLLGSPEDAKLFVERAMSRFGAPLEPKKAVLLAHVGALEPALRARLKEHDLTPTLPSGRRKVRGQMCLALTWKLTPPGENSGRNSWTASRRSPMPSTRRWWRSGGLHILGTERHEARRIDNQLRGRAGRQGDPGSSRFYLSLEDDLLRIFAGERISSIMHKLGMEEGVPIESRLISKRIESRAESG